jgi:homogentisate 1,2-dioxygenase
MAVDVPQASALNINRLNHRWGQLSIPLVTLHPAGVHHGPQPGAAEGAAKKEMTDEVAVMIECQQPLQVSPEAEKTSVEAYATSWARGLGLLDE